VSEDLPKPSPDELLSDIRRQEARSKRGRLKIFFGMAAGVGKSFAMLKAAHKAQAEGRRVVVGFVETHGRRETEALLAGLEVLPRKRSRHKEATLEDFDLELALAQRADLLIVDELPHTNAPGAKNTKRYQDVIDLLDAGFHVYTAMNVQHVESRADLVKAITGVDVRETVPDSILDLADEIELIDIPPEGLLQRLEEGKIYHGDRAVRAKAHFFQKGNLTALREMSLRLTAERVDHDLLAFHREKQISKPWKASERLLVAVGASPTSEQLVRWTRRTAYNLEAPWIAVYVDTGATLSVEDQGFLDRNLELVRSLGGEIVSTADVDVTRALLRVARQRNVTQIVVGKPNLNYLRRALGESSPVNRLILESGDIDIYVVNGGRGKTLSLLTLAKNRLYSEPRHYLYSLGVVLGSSLLAFLLRDSVGYWSLGLIMLLFILIQGLFTGLGPILLTAVSTALVWDFCFIPPYFTFYVRKHEDFLMLLIYVAVALVTGTLMTRVRSRERAFESREKRAVSLYRFSRVLLEASSLGDVCRRSVAQVSELLDADIAIFVRDSEGGLGSTAAAGSGWTPSEKEFSVARWAFENKRPTGRFTGTLSQAEAIHFPLLVPKEIAGILSIRLRGTGVLTVEHRSFLETLSAQIALGVERELLLESLSRSKVYEESERLHKTLLSSLSHELRTPISAILGYASTLADPQVGAVPDNVRALTQEIALAGNRLNRLVENLLDISRLESGHLKPRLEWCALREIVQAALDRLGERGERHVWRVDLSDDLPLVQVDAVMLENALHNLFSNAVSYSPPDTLVSIVGSVEGAFVVVRVADQGSGIPPDQMGRIFDKFYRLPSAPAGGVGLGLSVSKGFLEAMGGTLSAESSQAGGALFVLRLPRRKMPPLPSEALSSGESGPERES